MMYNINIYADEYSKTVRAKRNSALSRRHLLKSVVVFLSLAISLTLKAQEKPVYSLTEILHKIDSNNLSLYPYELRAKAYELEADAATAWMAPMIGAGTYMTPYPFQNSHDNGSVMFRVEQEIANKKKLSAKRNYISSLGQQEASNRAVVYNELREKAKLQYNNWLIAREKMRIINKTNEILTTISKVEEVRYPYNQSKLSNVYRTKAQLEKNKMEMIDPQNTIEEAKAVLNALMNMPYDFDFEIDTTYTLSATNFLPDTSLLASNRADIQLLNQSVNSLQLDIAALQLERKPTFSIVFDHMSPLSGSMPHSFSVMGMMSLPLAGWSKKSITSQVRAQEIRIEALKQERQAVLQRAGGQIAALQKSIKKSMQKLEALEQKVIPALEKTFDASFISYQENKESLDVVLNNWEALQVMQLDILNEKQNILELIAQYEKEIYK